MTEITSDIEKTLVDQDRLMISFSWRFGVGDPSADTNGSGNAEKRWLYESTKHGNSQQPALRT